MNTCLHTNCIFTIVTVSYNCIPLIEKTIQSVLEQDFPEKEYIIIDGGSTDGTVDIIRKYKDRLSFWCSEPDGGIYQGMNKGIRHAQGEWIIFMNAGDTFTQKNILTQVSQFASDRTYDILYGDIFTVRQGCRLLKKALEPCNKQRMYFCHQAAFVRTALMKEIPFDTRFRMSADFHFFKKCYLTGKKFLHIPVAVADYDHTGVSNTNRIKGLQDNIRVIRELDKGKEKWKFLCKLYYVIFWIKLRGHH